MRKEATLETVGKHFACVQFKGLEELVRAILEADPLTSDPLTSATKETDTLRAAFRKKFLADPDPTKKAWVAFVREFHRAQDPEGCTVLGEIELATGLFAVYARRTKAMGEETAVALNRTVQEAAHHWDYPPVVARPAVPETNDALYARLMRATNCCQPCRDSLWIALETPDVSQREWGELVRKEVVRAEQQAYEDSLGLADDWHSDYYPDSP